MDVMHERIFDLLGKRHGAIKDLAAAIGVSGNLVSNWKAGVSKSYTKYAPQIASYYGVSLDWLSGVSDDMSIKKEASPVSETSEEAEAVIEEIITLLAKLPQDKLVEELHYLRRIADAHGIR